MKYTEFASIVRWKTRTDAVTFTDTDILLLANIYKDEISSEIAKRNEDYFGMAYTSNLVAGQREYGLPDNLLNNIKRVEAQLDGIKWKILNETDLNIENYTTDEAGIKSAFNGKDPCFEIYRRSLWLLNDTDVIDVTGGIKLWAIIYPANFANLTSSDDMAKDPSSTTFGFPRQFHELLCRRVVIEYKSNKEKPIALTEHEQKYEVDLQKALGAITGMNLDRTVKGKIPYNSGTNY